MRITLLQDSIVWADKPANLLHIGKQIATLAGQTDLVVLPEMFTTGFCTDQLHLAEDMDGETVRTLKMWAANYQLALTGSFIATENGKTYNRAFFVFPNGEIKKADKRHLFSMGGENQYFTPGNERMVVNYCGFNICVLVCYDIRFPVWSRNVNNEYDLLIFVANFPERRIADWDILLRARAIENQCYVCGLNIVGKDAKGITYNGHSVLLDYNASPIISFAENTIAFNTAEIAFAPLQLYRQKFPVWKDADKN